MVDVADEQVPTAAEAWSQVAEAWDAEVDEVDEHSAAATAAMVDRLAVGPGDRVLELAAGPGSLAATWSALVGPTGSVVVSDVAPAMVEVERRRIAGLANAAAEVIDATAIDRPDASFDVAACRMGLMFAPDPAAAVAEVRRVLRPGGRVGVMTWAGMEHNPWMTCVGMAAIVHGLVAGGPPVGPGGIFSLSDPVALGSLLEDAGFGSVVVDEHDIVFLAPDIDDHIERVSSLAGPLAGVLRSATPEQRDAVRATAAEIAAPHLTDDGLAMPGRALVATGRLS